MGGWGRGFRVTGRSEDSLCWGLASSGDTTPCRMTGVTSHSQSVSVRGLAFKEHGAWLKVAGSKVQRAGLRVEVVR